jgi:hypothetical protein
MSASLFAWKASASSSACAVPFERVTRREFVINLKTARDLSLTISVDLQKAQTVSSRN